MSGEANLLMVPGPTNVDPTILRSLSKPTMSHTSASFANIFKATLENLHQIFQTRGLILPITGSGTLGAEVALENIIEPGDQVLVVSCGYFSDRLADIAATQGAIVDKIEVEWGSAVNPRDVEKKLSASPYKALLVAHVETSTGIVNPVQQLGKLVRSKDILFVVDAVCSLGGMDLQTDAWGVDVCFTGSQKALALPPGLAIVSFSPKSMMAREHRKSPMRTYYGDIKHWEPVLQDPTKYFATHAVNMIYALYDSSKMILSEGLSARFARHARMAAAFRASLKALRIQLLTNDLWAGDTLTVALYPERVNDDEFRRTVGEKGVVIAGGLGPLKGKVFRVGHMGNVSKGDVLTTVSAIEAALAEQRFDFAPKAGIEAVNRILTEQ